MTKPNQFLIRASREFLLQINENSLKQGRESCRELAKSVQALRLALDDQAHAVTNESATRLWIVHPKAKETPYFSALSAGDFVISCFSDADSAAAALKKQKPSLILVSSEFAELIQTLHDKHSQLNLVLIGNEDISASVSFLQSHPHLNHMIFEHAFESIFMQRNLLSSCEKMATGDVFGIEKYLDHGAPIVEAIITGNESRSNALDKLDQDLSRAGLSNVLTRKAHHLADELLMNAIYDAPIDNKTGLSRYNHLTRSVRVELEPSEYARLRYGFDGTVLALSIDDPFGALPRDIILKYLKSCFEGQFGKLNEKEGKGGGGMGLYQIMSSADLFVANVIPKSKTEVIVLVNVHERLPLRTHSFHYFTKDAVSPKQKTAEDEIRLDLLPKIILRLEALAQGNSPELITEILALKAEVESTLKPSPGESAKSRSLLLISPNKRHQRTLKASLGVSDYGLDIYEKTDDIEAHATPCLIAVDDTICDAVPKLSQRFPQAKFVAFSDRNAQVALDEMVKFPVLEQVFSLDLPKAALHKIILTHLTCMMSQETIATSSYLSFGAKLKKLDAAAIAQAPRSQDELDRLQGMQKALASFGKTETQIYGYDPHVFLMSQSWQESKSRKEWLETLQPNSTNPAITALYKNAHAIIFRTDGKANELTILRFLSPEEISEPFLYTFFNS